MSNVLKENYKKLVDALAPYFGGASDFDDLTNRPQESDAIDIDDLDLPMPAKPTDYPILFDETSTEYKVGYYKRASDGKVKPIYQKTIDCGALPNDTTKTVAHGIQNIDKIVELKAIANDNSTGEMRPIPSVNILNISYGISTDADKSVVSFATGMDRTNFNAYATLKYTKTTDEFRDL